MSSLFDKKLARNANASISATRYDAQVITNIAKIRDAKGIKQYELADMLGLHVTNLNKLEKGHTNPKLDQLEMIASILGVTVAELVSDEAFASARKVVVRGFVQAGHFAEAWQWDDDESYAVYVQNDEALKHFALHGAEVRGPSMNKAYPEGTTLVFTDMIETGETVEVGRRYIIERERADGLREATVKTLWRDDTGKLWLVPESNDPRFQEPIPLEGGEDDTVRIVGRVRYAVTKE